MVEFPAEPNLTEIEPGWYRLDEDYSYTWACPPRKYQLTIKAGFCCDLASVPHWLQWLVGEKALGTAPVLTHDVVYACQGALYDYEWAEWQKRRVDSSIWYPVMKAMERKTADQLLYKQMISLGFSDWKATPVYYAVRLHGNYAWLQTRDGDERY